MKKDFKYFTNQNDSEIYIEDRGGRVNRYVVWNNNSMVWEGLNKKDALALANSEYKSIIREAI